MGESRRGDGGHVLRAQVLRGVGKYAKFPQKLHEIERIWTGWDASKILLYRSATSVKLDQCIMSM